MNVENFPKRKPIPQSLRFEVFKRDAFTCQYCGRKAPEVILHLDHIKPVADGGGNDIINLITACAGCNGGKGARALDDHATLEKQRAQLEELNERRNQLEMMVKWREELAGLEQGYIQAIQNEFLRYSPFTANETGEREIRKWIATYSFEEIMDAIRTSYTQYVKNGDDGKPDPDTVQRAFRMVPRIANVKRSGGMSPEKMRLFYIRGILRKRCRRLPEHEVMDVLTDAMMSGVDLDRLTEMAKVVTSWRRFVECVDYLIADTENNDA